MASLQIQQLHEQLQRRHYVVLGWEGQYQFVQLQQLLIVVLVGKVEQLNRLLVDCLLKHQAEKVVVYQEMVGENLLEQLEWEEED